VCFALKSKCYVDRLVQENEENDRLEEAEKKDELLQKQQLLDQEKIAQKSQEKEFGESVCKMLYVLLEDKFQATILSLILSTKTHKT